MCEFFTSGKRQYFSTSENFLLNLDCRRKRIKEVINYTFLPLFFMAFRVA